MKKFLSGLLCLALLAACAPAPSPSKKVDTVGATELTAGLKAAPLQSADGVAGQKTNYPWELLKQALKEPKKNPVISPLSAQLALSMVANGAKGETLSQFERLFGISLAEMNKAAAQGTAFLEKTGGSTKLSIANSVWIQNGFEVKPPFLQAAVDYYRAQIYRTDLSKAKGDINRWVSQRTNDMIPSLLDQDPEPDMRMILVNALYMNAKWKTPFDPNNTGKQEFIKEDGSKITTDFLRNGQVSYPYFQQGAAEGALLPYDDGKLAFLVVRPVGGQKVGELVNSLSADLVQQWINAAVDTKLNFSMPKFTFDYSILMNRSLKEMGLQKVFTDQAEFENLSEKEKLFIGFVLQKVKIDVNEKGTEAAAATAVGMRATAAPAPQDPPKVLRLDSPFVYAVVDRATGTPLFAGIYQQPQGV